MKCPICGSKDIVIGAQDVPYSYKGHDTLIKDVHGEHCTKCHEVVMNTEQAEAFLAKVKAFEAAVDSEAVQEDGAAEPYFIAEVRNKLHLTQREASEIFGGGVNAFSRYEGGKAKAPRSTVKLLRVLDAHPELLGMIRD